MKLHKFKNIEILKNQDLTTIFGGSEETIYNCYCNGVPTGTATSSDGCAAKCA